MMGETKLSNAPNTMPMQKSRGKNWRTVAGVPSLRFTNGLNSPYCQYMRRVFAMVSRAAYSMTMSGIRNIFPPFLIMRPLNSSS